MAIEADTECFDQDLKRIIGQLAGMPAPPRTAESCSTTAAHHLAIVNGAQKYTAIYTPVLAIFADPHEFRSLAKKDPTRTAALRTHDEQATTAQVNAFQTAVPQAHVVRIPDADHFLYMSNADQVVREITTFISALPQ